jgi:uncharacterized protein (TIGR02302 family)
LNGSTPDRPEHPRTAEEARTLELAQALGRARLAVAWERGWPHIARLLTVAGLFLAVSWAGLWVILPFVRASWPLRSSSRWPLWRWFRRSGFAGPRARTHCVVSIVEPGLHRPATALTDTLTSQDPLTQALWQEQRARTLASIKRIRAGLPSPRLALHDPWALRALVVVLMVATYVAAGSDRFSRVAAFDWDGAFSAANVRVDAWVTPPPYTSRPPIILSASANKDAPPSRLALFRSPPEVR